MASKTIVELYDDLDGSEAAETVQFGLDSVEYEIDLSDENAAEFRDALAAYITHGRRTGGTLRGRVSSARQTSNGTGTPNRREELKDIRDWAKKKGYDVAERGRVAASIIDAYYKAH